MYNAEAADILTELFTASNEITTFIRANFPYENGPEVFAEWANTELTEEVRLGFLSLPNLDHLLSLGTLLDLPATTILETIPQENLAGIRAAHVFVTTADTVDDRS